MEIQRYGLQQVRWATEDGYLVEETIDLHGVGRHQPSSEHPRLLASSRRLFKQTVQLQRRVVSGFHSILFIILTLVLVAQIAQR